VGCRRGAPRCRRPTPRRCVLPACVSGTERGTPSRASRRGVGLVGNQRRWLSMSARYARGRQAPDAGCDVSPGQMGPSARPAGMCLFSRQGFS